MKSTRSSDPRISLRILMNLSYIWLDSAPHALARTALNSTLVQHVTPGEKLLARLYMWQELEHFSIKKFFGKFTGINPRSARLCPFCTGVCCTQLREINITLISMKNRIFLTVPTAWCIYQYLKQYNVHGTAWPVPPEILPPPLPPLPPKHEEHVHNCICGCFRVWILY